MSSVAVSLKFHIIKFHPFSSYPIHNKASAPNNHLKALYQVEILKIKHLHLQYSGIKFYSNFSIILASFPGN